MPRLGLISSLTGGAPPSADTTSFISTWATTGSDETLTLPFVSDGNTINFTIDWGDGNTDTVTAHDDDLGQGAIDHVYASADTYTIKMAGTISGFKFNNSGDKTKLKTITQWGTFNISTPAFLYGCSGLTAISAEDAPTITTTNMTSAFQSCTNSSLTFGTGLNLWDVSSVTNMYVMFQGCSYFNGDISDWDTGEVTNMNYMFGFVNQSGSLSTDLGSWDVSKVANFSLMFYNARYFNNDLSDWNTGAATTFAYMFYNADAFEGDGLDSWDIADVTAMDAMFQLATGLTTANYNALLIAWEAQTEQADVTFHAGNATYEAATSAAATARAALVSNGWTITDGGEA